MRNGVRTPRLHDRDPSCCLEAAFVRIERDAMTGMPLINPALAVQAVGFERWRDQWLGALVTPWFINLVLVPCEAAGWVPVDVGERRFLRFAAGDFAFLGCHEPEVGDFLSCSLVSPPSGFTCQAEAVDTAQAALRLLHVVPGGGAAGGAPRGTAAAADRNPTASRRAFVLGRRA
jgi:[NiFe] hydrogenase assembly HybE family chaperone